MYTRDDYIKDKYISEHGDGIEKIHAKRRVREYELGGDPDEIEYIGSELERQKRIEKREKRQEMFIFPAILFSILVICFSKYPIGLLFLAVAGICWFLTFD